MPRTRPDKNPANRSRWVLVSRSSDETMRYGRSLAGLLKPGDVILLQGDLGSGKTTFVKGVVAGLGGRQEEVHSPTFVLMNLYPTSPEVAHCDLYRLNDERDIAAAGLDEMMGKDVVTIVEWPKRLLGFWQDKALVIEFVNTQKETTRRLRIRSRSSQWEPRVRRWLEREGVRVGA